MLVEFSVENFKSYGERQTLYMQPQITKVNKINTVATNANTNTNTNTNEQYQIQTNIKTEPHLLPVVGIFGANASGKSGLLEAIQFLETVIGASAERKKNDTFSDRRFKLNAMYQTKPMAFDISFIVKNDGLYQYELSFYPDKIIYEELTLTTIKNEKITLIKRGENKTYLHENIHKDKNFLDVWKSDINNQRTFLAFLGNKGDISIFDNVLEWFDTIVYWKTPMRFDRNTSRDILRSDELKSKVMDFLAIADIQIKNILVEEKKIELDEKTRNTLSLLAEEEGKNEEEFLNTFEELIKEVSTRFEHISVGGDSINFEFSEESEGTQSLYSLLGPLFKILEAGSLLIIDEINNSLHPYLVRRIIQLFTSSESNPNGAQLLFTTHDVTVLDESLLKRDQIYFAEKNPTTFETSLYSLSEFEEGSVEEFYKKDYPLPILLLKYLEGLYGAVPQIDWSTYNGKKK